MRIQKPKGNSATKFTNPNYFSKDGCRLNTGILYPNSIAQYEGKVKSIFHKKP